MKLAYVAGPFRGANSWEMERNIRRAEELALELWRAGYAVICPHTNTRFFQGAAPDEVWLEGDLEMLRRCDLVVCTEDWRVSQGAIAEVAEAHKRKIPVFEYGGWQYRAWVGTNRTPQIKPHLVPIEPEPITS